TSSRAEAGRARRFSFSLLDKFLRCTAANDIFFQRKKVFRDASVSLSPHFSGGEGGVRGRQNKAHVQPAMFEVLASGGQCHTGCDTPHPALSPTPWGRG